MSQRSKSTPRDAAEWMAGAVNREGCLYQDEAADHLHKHFGKAFADENDTGGMSIAKDVLAEFRAMTAKTVVWDRGEKCWRRRERGDGSGRLADGT